MGTCHTRGKGWGLSQDPAGTAGVHISLKMQASQHGRELCQCVMTNLLSKVMVTLFNKDRLQVPMKQPQRKTWKLG